MDRETTRACMMEQVETARTSRMTQECGWTFEVNDLTVYVTIHPRKRPDLEYCLRVMFDDFPRQAPSYVFVDKNSKELSSKAWPNNVKHGAEPPGICTPGTRECHEHYHKNDAKYQWSHEKYPFITTLLEIQRMTERGL